MNTGQLVARVLDPGWLSEQAGRPVRAARLRIKPRTSLVVGLDDTAGHPAGWLRFLWPISHNKAARTRREAGELGLETAEHELGELLAQTGPLPADPKLLKRIAAATASGKLGRWEASQVLRYNPLRRVVVRDGMRVVRVATSRDRGVAFDRFIAGVVETPLRLDDGTLDGVSVHAFTGAQDLAGLLAGNPPSRPSDESRLSRAASDSDESWLSRAASDSDGSWLSRAASDSDGSWLSRAASEASGPCRNHPGADRGPIRAAGAMLARLHVAGVPDDLARSLALRAPDPAAQGLAHAALLDELAPGLAERMRRVVARFPGAASAIPVLSHGDLSPDQVLTTRTGDRVWLTDFDRACLAPRAVDLGSFIAVLDDDAFLDGYRDGGGQLPPGDQLRRAVAASLILRAADPLRRASRAWEQEISANLDRIMEVLK
ncbi:phosphotransferase family protein [Arachnia propionica]|uniref:Phosphotransferase enzyme family n=1 Tax=Arachnia propionica TaxID=1750 RepID=A0A3S4UAF3_9ACTN|nr:phosphotransferase [Arachnia propionica]VEH68932.1 Phosphotransferase enzyme family [Arachnia propionica]